MELTHLILLEHHKVKVLYPLLRVFPHPLFEACWVDNVADILVDERISASSQIQAAQNLAFVHILGYIHLSPQSKSLFLRLHDFNFGILPLLEAVEVSAR